eukprot:145670_1
MTVNMLSLFGLFASIVVSQLASSMGSIIKDYDVLSDNIKSGLIEAVVFGDQSQFDLYLDDLGLDKTKSGLLFDFIERTATLQLGFAFAQFEARSEITFSGIWYDLPLDSTFVSRNIALNTAHGGIEFTYPGIYKISINYRGDSTSNNRWSMIRVQGYINGEIVGQSCLSTDGDDDQAGSLTFLLDIEDENDIYIIQIVKRFGDSQTISFEADLKTEWSMTKLANVVTVIDYVGQKV